MDLRSALSVIPLHLQLLQYNLLRNRYLFLLLTDKFPFWKRVEKEVDLSKYAGAAGGKKKFSFVEIDSTKLVDLFKQHWQALT